MYFYTAGPRSCQALSRRMPGSLMSPLGLSTVCAVSPVLGSPAIHVSGSCRTAPLHLIRCPGAQRWQLLGRTLFLLHKGKEPLPSSRGLCVLGKANFGGALSGSQGSGGEGLLTSWMGFALADSCLCSFLPVSFGRNHAVHLHMSLPFFDRPAMDSGTRWMIRLWLTVTATQLSGSKPTYCFISGNSQD